MRRMAVVPVLAVAMVLTAQSPAFARKPPKGGGSASTGYDVAGPQCGTTLPKAPLFGIVGVNNGIVYSANPCLTAQYQWAAAATNTTGPKVSFYANTANPGTTSTHWPTGQTSPRSCDGTLSVDCSYDYGWNAAADSFQDAVNVAGSAAASSAPWWVDVETANSWQSSPALNNADIQGGLDYLASRSPAAAVGLYTNRTSWQTIMGSTSQFAGHPSWVPGASSLSGAKTNCAATITGGPVVYAQYPSSGFDADYACP
jgi:hypothetical protein